MGLCFCEEEFTLSRVWRVWLQLAVLPSLKRTAGMKATWLSPCPGLQIHCPPHLKISNLHSLGHNMPLAEIVWAKQWMPKHDWAPARVVESAGRMMLYVFPSFGRITDGGGGLS